MCQWWNQALESPKSLGARLVNAFFVGVVLLSFVVFVWQHSSWAAPFSHYFGWLELIIITVFITEFGLRVWAGSVGWRIWRSPLLICDIVVILSLLAHISEIEFLRVFRLMRLLYLLHILHYSPAVTNFFSSFRHYRHEFSIFLSFFLIVWLLGGALFFSAENLVNPQINTALDGFWWSLVTLSALGYGDIVPFTGLGRLVAGGVIVCGLLTLGFLTALITRIFIDHFFSKKKIDCPDCPCSYHDADARFCKSCGVDLTPSLGNKTKK